MEADRSSRWVDEDDVALIDALHVNPRASFEQIGTALNLAPVTVGRRWRRLTGEGRAWISSAPGPALPLVGAIVEIVWPPDKLHDGARALADLPQVFSVNLTSGAHNGYALLVAGDMERLDCFLIEDIPHIAHARTVTSNLVIELFSGAHWRLGAIASDAARALSQTNPETYASPSEHTLDDFDKDLFVALQLDGRRSVRDLALDVNRSEHAVRRRLEYLRRAGLLTFRTDFVRAEGGWAVQVKLSLRVPDDALSEVGHRVAAWPETRVCAAVLGAANLMFTAQLQSLPAADLLLRRIRNTWPNVDVLDRQVVLRPVKSWGRVLNVRGRAVDVVPVNPWA